jgi:hypothetical protein
MKQERYKFEILITEDIVDEYLLKDYLSIDVSLIPDDSNEEILRISNRIPKDTFSIEIEHRKRDMYSRIVGHYIHKKKLSCSQ